MKVILLEELKGKGGEGDVVDVARRLCQQLPACRQSIAIPATKGNLKQLEKRKHNIAKREENAHCRCRGAEGQRWTPPALVVDAQVGDEGQLFGSVTSAAWWPRPSRQQLGDRDRQAPHRAGPAHQDGRRASPCTVSIYREIKATVTLLVGDEVPRPRRSMEADGRRGAMSRVPPRKPRPWRLCAAATAGNSRETVFPSARLGETVNNPRALCCGARGFPLAGTNRRGEAGRSRSKMGWTRR